MSENSRRAAVSNTVVAEKLGVDHSMVSRVRSGNRVPSIGLMFVIQGAFGWDVAGQAEASNMDCYASEFEAILIQEYGAV